MSQAQRTESARAYFDLALAQSARVNLAFLLDKCQISLLRSSILMVKNGHFVIRATMDELNTQQIIWGGEVSGYFDVRVNNKTVLCNFTTRLSRLYNGPLNSMYLIFPLPETIGHNQRRFSKRVNMDDEATEGFGLWHGTFVGGGQEKLPELLWTALNGDDLELGELSASGMRLDVRDSSPLIAKLNIQDQILLKGDFGKEKAPNQLFVLGNIVRSMRKPESEGIRSYGCHFRAWRKVVTPNGNTWFRADDQDGVALIAEWLSRNFRTVA